MIATFFLLYAFIRSINWSRRTNELPIDETTCTGDIYQQQSSDTTATNTPNSNETTMTLTHNKLSSDKSSMSVFSRSDSSATTASSVGAFNTGKKRLDSISSASVFSDGGGGVVQQTDRRSSEGTRLGGHRRYSGRVRRYTTRSITGGGPNARRRTTGRFV